MALSRPWDHCSDFLVKRGEIRRSGIIQALGHFSENKYVEYNHNNAKSIAQSVFFFFNFSYQFLSQWIWCLLAHLIQSFFLWDNSFIKINILILIN